MLSAHVRITKIRRCVGFYEGRMLYPYAYDIPEDEVQRMYPEAARAALSQLPPDARYILDGEVLRATWRDLKKPNDVIKSRCAR